MRVVLCVAAAMALLATPSVSHAQQGDCSLDRTPRVRVQNQGTPYEMAYLGGPILVCDNGMRITADSAIYTAAAGEVHFLGRVRFTDPTRRLDSDFAQYMIENRHLAAQGNVHFLDQANGSTIRSPALDFMMESPERPESRVEVYSGRPRTILVATREGEAPDSTIVDSDALTIIGEQTFIGRGDVVLRRGDLNGSGGELNFDQAAGTMLLRGSAELTTEEYRLAGRVIEANMAGDTLREVTATGEATLLADEIDVASPHIRIGFTDGLVEHLVAIRNAPPMPGGEMPAAGSPDAVPAQPRVNSPEFIMVADSIDVLAPGQRIERLYAVGDAYGERVPTDSAEIAAADTLPSLIARDWVRGDTIEARFVDAPPAAVATVEADTAAVVAAAEPSPPDPDAVAGTTERGPAVRGDRAIEWLVVRGGASPASSAYRMREEGEAADAEPTFNYLLAQLIRVSFVDGVVKHVEAEGDIQGVYIRPTAQTVTPPPNQGRRR